MSLEELKNYLSQINKDYTNFCNDKDKQSLFYIDQMTELFYTSLLYQVYDQPSLYDLVYNIFRANLGLILKNMNDYAFKVSKSASGKMDELINISTTNNYVDIENLNNLYNNFAFEVTKNFSINDKIKALVSANMNTFEGDLFTKLVINDKEKVKSIIIQYKEIFINEMVNNIVSKKNNLLDLYRNFIDSILNEVYLRKDELEEKNLDMLINTTYVCLQEYEYININKYIDLNIKLIDEVLKSLEEELLNINITKNKKLKIDPIRDYLLGFNNTMDIKIKNVFDEMNLVVTLSNEDIDKKLKDFNDTVTHIYEMNLIFDKKFEEYKNNFNIVGKDIDKFNEIIKIKNRSLTDGIKANIFNIFRENVKFYNDVIYKMLLIKSKLGEYKTVLSKEKIKDLLLK